MGFLRVISDHLDGVFELPDKPQKLGRGSDCDIQIPHKSVSRHHCIITQSNNQLRVEDLGSTYGTKVNGNPVSDGSAVEGDKLRVGRVVLVYENELSLSSVRVLRNQEESLPIAAPIAPAPKSNAPASAVRQPAAPKPKTAPAPARRPAAAPKPAAASPASPPPSGPSSGPPNVPAAPAPKPALPKLAPAAPAKPKASKPKPAAPIKPVLASKAKPPEPEIEEEDGNATEDSGAPVGVFANIGGRKKGGKPKRHDYNKESDNWEQKADEQASSGSGPDYAAEADEWDEVWGKQRNHKRFSFPGLGWLGGLFGIFGDLGLKMRMMIVLAFMIFGAGGAKFAYDKATAQVLVPKKRAGKPRTNPSTGLDKGDEVLDKAIESFQKAIPKELQNK